ncbi:MAG: hypothetical protein AB7T06_07795 [Kofleriaceae bacterium]
MAFDDLAKHMAAREGRQVAAPTDANEFMRRAAEENRRIDKRNDIILGAILLLGGLGVGTLALQVSMDGGGRTGLLGASVGGVIWGAQRLFRGFTR